MNSRIMLLRGITRAEEAIDKAMAELQAEEQRFRKEAERYRGDEPARENLLSYAEAAELGFRVLLALYSAAEEQANAVAQEPEVNHWLTEYGEHGFPNAEDPWSEFIWRRNGGPPMPGERVD